MRRSPASSMGWESSGRAAGARRRTCCPRRRGSRRSAVLQLRTFNRNVPSASAAAASSAPGPVRAVPSHSSPSAPIGASAASIPSPTRKDSASTARSRSSSRVIPNSATASITAVTHVLNCTTEEKLECREEPRRPDRSWPGARCVGGRHLAAKIWEVCWNGERKTGTTALSRGGTGARGHLVAWLRCVQKKQERRVGSACPKDHRRRACRFDAGCRHRTGRLCSAGIRARAPPRQNTSRRLGCRGA